MRSKIIYIVLGFSLGLNISLGWVFVDRWINQERTPWETARFCGAGDRLPPGLRAKLAAARRSGAGQFQEMQKEIRDARLSLYKVLQEFPPDRTKIDGLRDSLNQLQERRQNLILDRILEETKSMNPEERRAYFELLAGRFLRPQPGGGDGPPPRRRGNQRFFQNGEGRP